jgi:Tfp pilus assembly protein PilF
MRSKDVLKSVLRYWPLSVAGIWLVVGLLSWGYFRDDQVYLGLVLTLPAVIATIIVVIRSTERSPFACLARSRLAVVFSGVLLFLAGSLVTSVYFHASLVELLKFAALAAWFVFGFAAASGRTSLRSVVILLVVVGSSAAVVAVLAYTLHSVAPASSTARFLQPVLLGWTDRLGAFLGYPNTLAAFLYVPLLASVGYSLSAHGRVRRGLAGGAVIVSAAALLLTQSRAALMLFTAGLAGMLAVRLAAWLGTRPERRKVLAVAGGVVITVVLVLAVPVLRNSLLRPVLDRLAQAWADIWTSGGIGASSVLGDRLRMMRDGLRYAAAYPVAGSGPGTYPDVYLRFQSARVFSTDPHSLPVKLLAESGFIGGVLQMLLLGALTWIVVRASRRAMDQTQDWSVPFAAAGCVLIIVHACVDWDWLFLTFPWQIFLLAGSAAAALWSTDPPWLLRPAWPARVIPGSAARETTGGGAGRPAAIRSKPAVSRAREAAGPVGAMVTGMWALALVVLIVGSPILYAASRAYSRGSADAATEEAPRAGTALKKAASLDPGNATYRHALARYYQQMDTSVYKGSVAAVADWIGGYFADAVRLDPLNPEYLGNYGAFLVREGSQEATGVYERLVETDPLNVDAIAFLAMCYDRLVGDTTKALATIEKALVLQPAEARSLVVKGYILEDRGDTRGALASYEAAVRADAANVEAIVALGQAYISGGQIPHAIAVLAIGMHQDGGSEARTMLEGLTSVVTLRSLSPGFDVVIGMRLVLSWTVSGKSNPAAFEVVAIPENGGVPVLLSRAVPGSARSYTWTVPVGFAPGTYSLEVRSLEPALMRDQNDNVTSYDSVTGIVVTAQ